jgi:hypothetical protein
MPVGVRQVRVEAACVWVTRPVGGSASTETWPVDGFTATTRSPVSPVTTKRASSPRFVRAAPGAPELDPALAGTLGGLGVEDRGGQPARTGGRPVEAEDHQLVHLEQERELQGVAERRLVALTRLLEARSARWRNGLLEAEVDPEAGVLPELHDVGEGVRLRPPDQDLVRPGDQVEGRRRVSESEAVDVDRRPRRLGLHREPDLACTPQLGAELVEPLPERGRESVRAHDMPRIDPEHRAEGVVRGFPASLRAQRHPADQLGITEGLRAVRSGREALELGQGLVEQGERVGDAIVVEEVLGGRHLPSHLVERVRGRRADARLELLDGEELRPDPVRQPLLELSRVPQQVRVVTVTERDQGHAGCRPPHPWRRAPPRASRRESRPREAPSAPAPSRPWHAARKSSQKKASNEGAGPLRAMV